MQRSLKPILTIVLLFLGSLSMAQGTDTLKANETRDSTYKDFRKSVYVSGNSILGLNAGFMLNYEVPIFRKTKSRGIYGLIVSSGAWYNNWDWGPIIEVKFNYLLPWDGDYLELMIGGGATTSPSIYNEAPLKFYGGPQASIGYRYKIPDKKMTFKVTLGIPEGILLGVGINLN